MKKINVIIIALLLIGFAASISYARPPSSIELEYDLATKTLMYNLKHVTKNPRDHHIRKIVIFLNDEEMEVIRLVTQTTNQEVSGEAMLNAVIGDTIRLKAICNKAGLKEASLVVAEAVEPQEEK